MSRVGVTSPGVTPSRPIQAEKRVAMKMFVRYVGTGVCWTLDDGRFYMGVREELTPQEREVCEAGGGYLPASASVLTVAA